MTTAFGVATTSEAFAARTEAGQPRLFSWKPAPLRSRRSVEIGPRGFRIGGAELQPWNRVQELSFALDRSRGVVTMRLRVGLPEGDVVLFANDHGELPLYRDMLRAWMAALAAARPDMKVLLGHGGATRRGMFLVGSVSLLLGLALVVFGALRAVELKSSQELGTSFVGLVLGSTGLVIARANRPGSAPPSQAVSEFSQQLEGGA